MKRLVALLLLLATAGCREPAPEAGPAGAQPVERTATRGPLTLSVRADKDRVTVGEKLTVTVDIVAEPRVELQIPDLVGSGTFDVHDRRTPPDVPDGPKRRWTHTYVLSTFDAGELQIPGLRVPFTDRRDVPEARTAEGAPVQGEVATEPFTVSVRSLLGDDPDQAELRDIKGPLDLPRGSPGRWIAAVLVGAIALALVVLLWRRRRREGGGVDVVVPPHLWALDQLQRLEQDRLVERDLVHEFFFRLSDIVRHYLERRFDISAPERTTQEFIREMRDHPVLRPEQQTLLAGFLRAADMVKFALHRPPRAESETALATAREFVRETALRLESGEGTPEAAA